MNYKKIHDAIIDRARNRILEGYSEKHHIVPTCMGGPNTKSNIVALTAEEHYVIHQLLVKIYPGNKGLIYAAWGMHRSKNNKSYGWIKRKLSKTMSEKFKGKPSSHKGAKHSPETLLKQSLSHKGQAAWNKGVPATLEHRSKNSLTHKGQVPWNKGKHFSEKTKQKMSEAAKQRWAVI
jgi:hypothetical protein